MCDQKQHTPELSAADSAEKKQTEGNAASTVITEGCKPVDADTTSAVGISDIVPTEIKSAVPVDSVQMPTGPKTRYEWYQTESHVVVSILIKNTKKEDLKYDIQETTLSCTIHLPSGSEYNLELDLFRAVVPEQSQVKILGTRVEIKLKKKEGWRWDKLECDGAQSLVKHFNPVTEDTAADIVHKYPSSSHCHHNWDQLEAQIKAEEKDEKLEGDAALNKLFQQIYADGSEETRRAMNKSFMESGGTVLSTNWKEIRDRQTDIKPPDGMEYKKWEY